MPTATTTIQAPDGQTVEYPARLLTIAQIEELHPALKGRMRTFVLRADLNAPDYAGLRDAVVRFGRSVYIDESRFLAWIGMHRGAPPDRPRNPDGGVRRDRCVADYRRFNEDLTVHISELKARPLPVCRATARAPGPSPVILVHPPRLRP